LFFLPALLLTEISGHGGIIALNGLAEDGTTASRNVQTNKGLHSPLVE